MREATQCGHVFRDDEIHRRFDRQPATARASSEAGERLLQIRDNIVRVLDADGQAHVSRRHTGRQFILFALNIGGNASIGI